MTSFIRTALKGNNTADTTIIMEGPLAEVFTQALNVAYAKKDPVTGEDRSSESGSDANDHIEKQIRVMTRESQQLDSHFEKEEKEAMHALRPKSELRVYAVSLSDIQDSDIVNFSKLAAAAKIPSELVLIAQKRKETPALLINEHIDKAVQSIDPSDAISAKGNAIQQMANSFSVRSYSSLEEFQNDLMN